MSLTPNQKRAQSKRARREFAQTFEQQTLRHAYFVRVSDLAGYLAVFFIVAFLITSCSLKAEKSNQPLRVVQTLSGATETRFGEVFGIAIDKNGAVFVSDGANGKIWQIDRTGAAKLITDKLDTPSNIAFDDENNLIVADSGSHTIKKINVRNGEISLVAGTENKAGFSDGAANAALFNAPVGVAAANQKIYVADTYNDKIRVIENNQVTTLAGTERGFVDGMNAKFDSPCGIAIDKNGVIFVADAGNRRIRQIKNSLTTTFAGNGEAGALNGADFQANFVEPVGISIDKFGAVYVADAGANQIRVFGRRLAPFWETVSGKNRGLIDGEIRETKFNRPTNIAVDAGGEIFVADSSNKLVRVIASEIRGDLPKIADSAEARKMFVTPEELRKSIQPRWTYNPANNPRDIAGTFGEVRGELKQPQDFARFHNGLDIAGATGETAVFLRSEKVLQTNAAQNFATLRELLRLPTLGYIHINLGREASGSLFNDNRFLFNRTADGKLSGVRVPRGAKFAAGDAIGTLNPMNHVHLIAGESGAEINAFAALELPGVKDSVAPKIEKVTLFDENWQEIKSAETLRGKIRIVAKSFDQMQGNNARRRLGVYRLGYQILNAENAVIGNFENISFDRLPDNEIGANLAFAQGSQSGYTPETVFNYTVTNVVKDGAAHEDFFDTVKLSNGNYKIRILAADFFGNQTAQELSVKIQN